MVHNDPKADQHEILLKKGSGEISRNGEVVHLADWEKVAFQSQSPRMAKVKEIGPPTPISPANMMPIFTAGASKPVEAQDTRDLLAKLLIEEREITDRPAAIEQFRRRLERARRLRRLRTVSQTVAEAQSQAASGAVPMDSSYVVELHQEGAGVHELVGGAAQALSVPAIESEDPSRSQGVTTHE
jgi:hypothetical protein